MYTFFLKHFLRNPSNVGAVVPLSHAAIDELLRDMEERADDRPWNILDAGAGVGNISEKIQRRMRPNDRLDLVEIDNECCEFLDRKFHDDKRVHIQCISIIDWNPKYQYDFIVSTLPFQNFDADFVQKIFDHYLVISSEGAMCSYIEYKGIGRLKKLFTKEKEALEKRLDCIEEFHKDHLVEKNSVYQNFLPSNVYHLQLHQHTKT